MKYIVVQNTYINGDATRVGYGIAAVEEYDGVTAVMRSFPDISSDLESVKRLTDLCNLHKLEQIHLKDVVDDFLVTV
ncbi:MAG: hypothetical protein E7633_06400 [Ruminococcaceae bacterium]|nr:hypothetical protein [Oscillospiraceae bacterium]